MNYIDLLGWLVLQLFDDYFHSFLSQATPLTLVRTFVIFVAIFCSYKYAEMNYPVSYRFISKKASPHKPYAI